MKWICTALTVTFLAAAHVVAQDLFVTIPATPTKNPLEGNAEAITAGMGAYRVRCADCHGMDARGSADPISHRCGRKAARTRRSFQHSQRGSPAPKCPRFRHPGRRTRMSGASSPT